MDEGTRPDWRNRPLSSDDVAELTGQIAGLTEAGLPLPAGLRALAEELPRGRLRSVLNRLADTIESGVPLDEAIVAQRGRIPGHLRGLVLAGARSGKLGEVLSRFAGYSSIGNELRRSLWLRLSYPAFSLTFAVGLFVFVCVVLGTGFEKIFRDFGMALPMSTRALTAVSAVVSEIWWPVLQGVLVLVAAWGALCLVLSTGIRRSLLGSIPLIGPVQTLSARAEFCHLLALLLESDVPVVESLPMAGEGVGSGDIASASRIAAREVAAGEPLAKALSHRSLFPGGFARILTWAEDHHGLPEALHMAGEMCEARARSQANFVTTVCGILAFLSLLGTVLMMVFAILVPMINLIGRLAG